MNALSPRLSWNGFALGEVMLINAAGVTDMFGKIVTHEVGFVGTSTDAVQAVVRGHVGTVG